VAVVDGTGGAPSGSLVLPVEASENGAREPSELHATSGNVTMLAASAVRPTSEVLERTSTRFIRSSSIYPIKV